MKAIIAAAQAYRPHALFVLFIQVVCFVFCCALVLNYHSALPNGGSWFWPEKAIPSDSTVPRATELLLFKKFIIFDDIRDLHGLRTFLFSLLPTIPITLVFLVSCMTVRCLNGARLLKWIWPVLLLGFSFVAALEPSMWLAICTSLLILVAACVRLVWLWLRQAPPEEKSPSQKSFAIGVVIPLVACTLTICFSLHTVRLYDVAENNYPLPTDDAFRPNLFKISGLLLPPLPPKIKQKDEPAKGETQVRGLAKDITTLLDREPRPPDVFELLSVPTISAYLDDSGPIQVNIVAAEFTLFFLFLTLLWWLNQPMLRSGWPAIGFVFLQYIVVGCIFGVLYYDYYVKDITKQNLVASVQPAVIRTFYERNQRLQAQIAAGSAHDIPGTARLPEADTGTRQKTDNSRRDAQGAGQEINTQKPDMQKLEVEKREAQKLHVAIALVKPTLALARAHYWSASVFAEDLPLYGVDPVHSLRFECEHTCYVWFRSGEYEAVRCGRNKPCVAVGDENKRSLKELREYLIGLSGLNYPAGRLQYQVELFGGADRISVRDSRSEVRSNMEYADRRANNLLYALRHEVDVCIAESHPSKTGVLHYLDDSLLAAPKPRVAIQPEHETDDAGCPADTACIDGKDWRVARLRILKGTPDENAASKVSLQLAEKSSLADMLYFSFATFTTTGYGDIKPVSDVVRFWSMVENIWEILFTAIFFAVAVATFGKS